MVLQVIENVVKCSVNIGYLPMAGGYVLNPHVFCT